MMHTVKYTCLYVQVRVPVPVGVEHELIVGLDCAFDALAHPGLEHELGVALARDGRVVRLPPVRAVEQRRAGAPLSHTGSSTTLCLYPMMHRCPHTCSPTALSSSRNKVNSMHVACILLKNMHVHTKICVRK